MSDANNASVMDCKEMIASYIKGYKQLFRVHLAHQIKHHSDKARLGNQEVEIDILPYLCSLKITPDGKYSSKKTQFKQFLYCSTAFIGVCDEHSVQNQLTYLVRHAA